MVYTCMTIGLQEVVTFHLDPPSELFKLFLIQNKVISTVGPQPSTTKVTFRNGSAALSFLLSVYYSVLIK